MGIPIKGATDAARGVADIILMELGLSTIANVIRSFCSSCIISQPLRNYDIHTSAVKICIVICFAMPVSLYGFKFPPFMVLIIALLDNGTIMTLSM